MNNKLVSKGIFTLTLFTLAVCSSCSKDDSGSPSTEQKETIVNNTNSNMKDIRPATHRLEFPRLKGGSSTVLTHILNTGEVNYSVEWDVVKKSNRWTCYEIYAKNAEKNVPRKPYTDPNQYPFDPLFPANAYYTYDPIYGSGYDHGHICPSEDRKYSRESNDQTFYLSNMQPQVHGFNAGVWETMESKMRTYITAAKISKDTLFICRGGTIDKAGQFMTMRSNVIVPKYFFSAALMKYKVYGKDKWEYKAIGFWFEHKNNNDRSLVPYVVNISELEQLTGIDFFCNLPDDIERKVESVSKEKIIDLWNIQ